MARKLRGLERVLDAPSLFAVAYGEIASSLYIALGIVAAVALGFTPLVLLVAGAVFVLVSLSYAEGTAALPETGGAATFVRRAFNDLAGFVTGWVLFLDFLIVMALSALFVPHYLAGAVGQSSLRESPWDAVVGCALIAAIAGVRVLDGRVSTSVRSPSRCSTCSCRALLVILGRRVPALAGDARRGARLRERPGLGRPRVRAATRDARVHGSRDRREPRRGGDRAGSHAAAIALLRDRARRRGDRAHRCNRSLRVPRVERRDRARGAVAGGAARRHRGVVRRVAPRAPRGCARGRGGDLRCVDPRRCRDDVVLGHHAPDVLARRARVAAAGVRAPRAPIGRVERGDRDRRGARDRAHPADGARGRRRPRLPREPLLVRRPHRLHRRPARRRAAADARAGPRAAVSRVAERLDSWTPGSGGGTHRSAADSRDLRARDDHAPRGALRRPRLARSPGSPSSSRCAGRGGGDSSSRSRRSESFRRAPSSSAFSCR